MDNLQDYQKSLIDGSLHSLKVIISDDYSIGKMNRALSDLKNDLMILPQYKKYVASCVHQIVKHYRHADKVFYKKYQKMNPKYIEIVLNLTNFMH